jgi:hypothetical protein
MIDDLMKLVALVLAVCGGGLAARAWLRARMASAQRVDDALRTAHQRGEAAAAEVRAAGREAAAGALARGAADAQREPTDEDVRDLLRRSRGEP